VEEVRTARWLLGITTRSMPLRRDARTIRCSRMTGSWKRLESEDGTGARNYTSRSRVREKVLAPRRFVAHK